MSPGCGWHVITFVKTALLSRDRGEVERNFKVSIVANWAVHGEASTDIPRIDLEIGRIESRLESRSACALDDWLVLNVGGRSHPVAEMNFTKSLTAYFLAIMHTT